MATQSLQIHPVSVPGSFPGFVRKVTVRKDPDLNEKNCGGEKRRYDGKRGTKKRTALRFSRNSTKTKIEKAAEEIAALKAEINETMELLKNRDNSTT
jgi:hypothetical protein